VPQLKLTNQSTDEQSQRPEDNLKRVKSFATRHKIITMFAVLFWVAIIVAGATGSSGTKKTAMTQTNASSQPKRSTTTKVAPPTRSEPAQTKAAVQPKQSTTTKAAPATRSEPQSQKDAVSYMKKFNDDMNRVQGNVLEEELALLAFTKSETETKLERLSTAAQSAHDGIDSIRQDFVIADQISDNSQLGRAETNIWQGSNDLKNAMGQMVAVTGSPNNAATAAKFKSEFAQAQIDWNGGVNTLYRLAYGSDKNAPTI
jgi:hypothetical protein